MTRTYYLYTFTDGHFCYTAGKLSKHEIFCEERKHGKMVSMKAM